MILKQKGFTLIEVVVSTALVALLMFVASDLLISIFKNPKQQFQAMDNIDQAKMVESAFINELRRANVGVDGSYPISQASATQIIFYTIPNNSTTVPSRIRYYISGDTLYKGVVTPTGSPLTYNLANEVVKPAISVLSNGASPVFYYYDGNYSGSQTELSQPVNVNQIKFVKINLVVKKQTIENSTETFNISVGTAVRNLKNNLGN